MNIIDEFSQECLSINVNQKLTSQDVLDGLFNLFIFRGIPEYICSEFVAKAIRGWLNREGVKTLFIELGSCWKNCYIESFNRKLRDKLLVRGVFTTLNEAKVLIEQWGKEYNHIQPHIALGYQPPVLEAVLVSLTS